MSESFVPSERSQVRRRQQRAIYDRTALYEILDAARLCHIGYVIDEQPYVTPTLHWRHGDHVYFHGSAASRMLRRVTDGLPVCLTVSHLDGLVLGHSGFHCSVNYRSAMLFGKATALADEAEKEQALRHFIDGIMAGRWEEMRPLKPQELKATMVCRMTIEEASAKIRSGMPKDDEPVGDIACWLGVIPVEAVAREPLPDPRMAAGAPVPQNVRNWRPWG